MKKKPIVRRTLLNDVITDGIDLHPVLRRIYLARGICSQAEIEHDLVQLLPFHDLLGIDQAAICLANSLEKQQRILIIGDFDADGATSTALAVAALKSFGAKQVDYLVPNRFEYGYGLTPEIVAVAVNKKDPNLIITVDNGISSLAGVNAANAAGVTTIITDHHLPGSELPSAAAIVNPQQPGDRFVSKNLAGVGVIFYVMLALRTALRERQWFTNNNLAEPNMSQFLDLVALGTVADLVPLDHNNRILVQQGLERIRKGKARAGILALLAVSGRLPQRLVANDLGYSVGPRLNAAGRLADMSLGIECLLAEDANRARECATQLNILNEERRQIEQEMKQQAFYELNKTIQLKGLAELNSALCLFDPSWHQGVIGLLASRIKDQLHRPVIVFAPGNTPEEIKGSARSIPGLHIRDVLDAIATRHPGLIVKFGGHAMAAGLTLNHKDYNAFSKAFSEEVQRCLDPVYLKDELYSDGELKEHDYNLEFAEQLRTGGPWGQAFPEPLFDGKFGIIDQRIVGNKHLKLTLVPDGVTKQLDAIAFNINIDAWPNYHASHIHAAYRLDVNEYLGRKSVQLIVEQLEVC